MVRDAEIFETPFTCGFRHCLKRLGAVRRGRVAVKYAAKVFIAHKLWQAVLCGSLQFRLGLRGVPAR